MKIYAVAAALCCTTTLMAQQNVDEILSDPSNNYYVIKQKADSFFARVGTVGTGWKQYKRWEFTVRQNVDAAGNIPDFDANNKKALHEFKEANTPPPGMVEAGVANWVPLGQQNPTIQAGDGQNGVGSLRCIELSGSDIWTGGAGGGLWFGNFISGSTYSWTPKTDGTPTIAMQDVIIAPTNSSILYALTGAVGGASGYRSTGVLKSTDGGNTWAETGLSFPASGGTKGYKLLGSKTSSNIVWACTTQGLYRTTDGGVTWNLVTYYNTVGGTQFNFSASTFDIEYQPISTTVLYATSDDFFYKSTDGGATFLRISNATAGLPASSQRIEIGVSDANSNYVYLLYANADVYLGLYRSTDGGATFSLRSSAPNVLGGQGWRNICIDVSPTNINDVYVGGLDVYKSTNGGTNWTQISFSGTTAVADFCHADIFDLLCTSTYLYAATDGGMYRLTRSTDDWVDLNQNMQIAQIYRFSVDPTASAAFVTTGTQDNGTYRNSGAQYLSIGGADGMETIIKPSNTNVIYLSAQNGPFYRSDDGGSTNTFIRSGPGNWTTPAVLRPGNDNHIYIGYVNIDYNTTSGAGAWSSITSGFVNSIQSLEFAPSNNTILYATDGDNIRRYNLSGGVWSAGTLINGDLPASLAYITEIAVDPNNANHVLISLGGYTATQKVYETFNANAASPTWDAITRNLPNVPINCIVMNNDASNSIYIGTDIGVFVTNDNRVNWIMYNNGLPTTRVYDIEINNAVATDRVYVATFGRGVFYADTYTGCAISAALTGNVTGLEYTEASSTITSTQFISGGAGTSLGYNAGSSVTLNPGFEIKAGSRIEIYIQGCTSSGQSPRPLTDAASKTAQPANKQPEVKPMPPLKPQGEQ